MMDLYLIFLLALSQLICNVNSKCGETITTYKTGTGKYFILLYPITISKANQSYNLPMVYKEIAYRNDYSKSFFVTYGIGFITYDFCNDLTTLIEILLKVTLNNPGSPNILGIQLHADAELIKTTQAILLYFQVSLSAVISDIDNKGLSTYSTHNLYDSEGRKSYLPYNSYVYHETSFGFIESHSYNTPNSGELEMIASLCYAVGNICQCLPVETKFLDQPNNFVLYFGDISDVTAMKDYFTKLSLRTKKYLGIHSRARYRIESEQLEKLLKDEMENLFIVSSYPFRTTLSFSNWDVTCSESIFVTETDKINLCNQSVILKTLDIFLTSNSESQPDLKKPITDLRNYTCKPTCPIGHTINFEEYEFIWKCVICQGNSVKDAIGNGKCNECLRGWEANINRTSCIDQYRNLSLKFTDNSSIIMISVSGFMLSGISSSILLYIKYSETPVVKSSNLLMSFIQLTAHLLTVIIMPFLFIGELNTTSCIFRPICIGILLTFSTSVTLSKTTTFLRIFQRRMKMTRREKIATKTIETLIVILLVICDACILFVSFKFKTPMEVMFVSDEHGYREKRCNNDNDIIVQLCFIFVILLFNSVQAIRARHLPANFKETRVIILATLLSCVIVGNVIWSYFLQSNYYWKSIFIFYAIFLLNGINFIILYIYKIYILLFLPEKNTRTYFHNCFMKKIRKQVNQRLNVSNTAP